jgi:hypothetical protein
MGNCARSCRQHDGEYKAWLSSHEKVFRAKSGAAKLTISDWASDDGPGGPVGQEIALNFVEIQPYLEE